MTTHDLDVDFAWYYREDRDPDIECEELYALHRALWGRAHPGVDPFKLEVVQTSRRYELALTTRNGARIRLASDAMINTWTRPGWAHRYSFSSELLAEIAADTDDFFRVASTPAAYTVWPLNGPGQTGASINQARGTDPLLGDRFDRTLECIRRHYQDRDAVNPLGDRLDVYAGFFDLFGDFDTYVRFFLLDDLLTEDRSAVRCLMSDGPVTGFAEPAVARSPEQYAMLRTRSIAFIQARKDRMRGLELA